MSRFVWPYLFTLRAGNLIAASKNQSLPAIRDKFFVSSIGNTAVALRWSCTPSLGFPREPFQVYRRLRNTIENTAFVTVLANATAVTVQQQTIPVLAGGDASYIVIASVAVAASSSVSVQAIDANGKPIPNQVLLRTVSGPIEFRCPGIAALAVSGSGTIGPIEAVGETTYANLPDWTQIQTVGLPLLDNEIGASYKTLPQGFWSTPLTPPTLNGVVASIDRTLVTALLEVAPPPTGITDFPLPVWTQPNASAYVSNIRKTGQYRADDRELSQSLRRYECAEDAVALHRTSDHRWAESNWSNVAGNTTEPGHSPDYRHDYARCQHRSLCGCLAWLWHARHPSHSWERRDHGAHRAD